MAKVLVVDDEKTLVDTIRYNLEREGFTTVTAYDGEEALETARKELPDLIILDVMLPKIDGFEVCRTIRREMTVPILMLTARVEEIDRIIGLEIGADDYLTKPFSMRELVARVRAALRRSQMLSAASSDPSKTERYTSDKLTVDVARHEVLVRGAPVTLKPKEFELLTYLIRNKGRVLTRDVLLENLWGYEYEGGNRTVDVHIRGIREKIENDPSDPEIVETIRGVGYRFRE